MRANVLANLETCIQASRLARAYFFRSREGQFVITVKLLSVLAGLILLRNTKTPLSEAENAPRRSVADSVIPIELATGVALSFNMPLSGLIA